MKSRRRTASPKSWANVDNNCNEVDYSTDLPSGEMGFNVHLRSSNSSGPNVGRGSIAPFRAQSRLDRFTPMNGHVQPRSARLSRANFRLMRCSKDGRIRLGYTVVSTTRIPAIAGS